MIAIRINKLFSRLGRGFHYSFAELSNSEETESSKQMRLYREQAVLSCKVIKTIIDAQPDNNRGIEEPSLREQILNLSIQGFKYSQESKNAVLKMFKEGIALNQKIYSKTSIAYGKQGASEVLQKRKDLPFIFCPNLLVTRVMFRILMFKSSNLMTLGGQGMSKTVSFVLFSQLSNIVNRYLYLAFSDTKEQSQLKSLKQRKLIFDVPKLFYWNMSFEGQNEKLPTPNQVKKNLLLQATELSDNQSAKFQHYKSLEEFATALKDMYESRKIETKVAVDQLNFCASLMRRWNVFMKESNQKQNEYKYSLQSLKIKIQSEKDQTKKEQLKTNEKKKYLQYRQWKQDNKIQRNKLEEQLFQPAKTLRSLMRQVFSVSSVIVLNSSMNIEMDILKRKVGYYAITLGLHDSHKELRQYQIQSRNHLSELWGRNDFNHYFWFEIQKKLSAKGFTQQKLQKFKQMFYTKVKDRTTPKYFRLLYIRQTFSQNKNLFDFPENFSEQQMGVRLDQIIQSLHYFSLQSCFKRINYFFEKVSSKDQFIRKIFNLMLKDMAKEQKQNGNGDKFMQINLEETDRKYFLGTKNKTRDFLHSEVYDKEFMDFSLQRNELFAILRWTPQEYLKINEYQILKEKYPSLSGQQIFMLFVKDYRFAGHAYQNALIKALQIPNTIFNYQTYKYLELEGGKTGFFIGNYKRIENSTYFLRFQKSNELSKQQKKTVGQELMNASGQKINKSNNCLQINLSKMLIMAKDNPNTFIFGSPAQLTKRGWNFCSSNPSTDFMIVSYVEKEAGTGHFVIESFDVTVTYSLQATQNKLRKAQPLLKDALQSYFEEVKAILSKEEKDTTKDTTKEKIRQQFLRQQSSYQQIKRAKMIFTHSIVCPQKIAKTMKIIENKDPNFTINFIPIESIHGIILNLRFYLHLNHNYNDEYIFAQN